MNNGKITDEYVIKQLKRKPEFAAVGQIRDEALLNKIVLRLKQLRSDKGLSQDRVYVDTDIHIGRIEAEKVNVSISTLKRLCTYYEVSLSDFFSEMGE